MSRGGLIEAGLTTPEASTVTSPSPTFTMPCTNLQTTHRIPCYQIISNIHYTGWPKKNSTMSVNKDVNRVLCELFWLLMVSWNASSCFDTIEAKNTENTKKVRGTNATKWLGAAGAPPIYSTLSSQPTAPLIHPHNPPHRPFFLITTHFHLFCLGSASTPSPPDKCKELVIVVLLVSLPQEGWKSCWER